MLRPHQQRPRTITWSKWSTRRWPNSSCCPPSTWSTRAIPTRTCSLPVSGQATSRSVHVPPGRLVAARSDSTPHADTPLVRSRCIVIFDHRAGLGRYRPHPHSDCCGRGSDAPACGVATGRSRAHRNDDGVAPEAEHQPLALRLQVHDYARLILHPEIAGARRADRKAVAGLAIGAGELPERAEVVHLARCINGGEADAADPGPADLKRILHAAKEQDAGPRAAAADVRRLHLPHLDGGIRGLALDRVWSELDPPCAPSNRQHARADERDARDDRLHRLRSHWTSPCVPCVGIHSYGKCGCAST